MQVFNPVIKNGRFLVNDTQTGTIKVFQAQDAAEARYKMLKHLNTPTGNIDDAAAINYGIALTSLRVTEVEPTKRKYN